MTGERRLRLVSSFAAAIVAIAFTASALAASKGGNSASILPGGNSKEPISIEADKLVYFDKEQKAIYSGNVIAIQGDSKLTCSALTIFLAKNEEQATEGNGQVKSPPAPATGEGGGEPPSPATSQVKHMEAAGPVTVVSKTQVATGDRGIFDKVENKVWLLGNVTLSDGGNVTKGDKLTYDMTTGQATVERGRDEGRHERVQGLFIPSSNDNNNGDKSSSGKKKLPDNSAPKH
jgi:lipopolysaccharide export system protein LptA